MSNPFRYFNSSPEVIGLAGDVREIPTVAAQRRGSAGRARDRHQPRDRPVLVEPFGPMFAAEIHKRRIAHMRRYPQWRWHLDEVFVKVNGELCYLARRRP
jgi:putative transposase